MSDLQASAKTWNGRNDGTQESSKDDARNDMHSTAGHAIFRSYRMVLLCVGVMCIVQATLNVVLRVLPSGTENATAKISGDGCVRNVTTEMEWLQTRCDQLQRQKGHLQTRYDQMQSDMDQLQRQKGQLQTRYDQLQRDMDQLQTRYDQLQNQKDPLQTRYDQLQRQKDQLQTRYDQLQRDMDQLQTRYDQLQNQKDPLQTRYDQLQRQKGQLQTRYDQLQKELDQSRAEVKNCEENFLRLQESTCPAGWTTIGSSIYYVSTATGNWSQGWQDCRARGADLVVIDSRDEQNFIRELTVYIWIGLNKTNSVWTWVDGSPLSTVYWLDGEPNGYDLEADCVHSIPNPESLNSWNDEQCHVLMNWVCERRAC